MLEALIAFDEVRRYAKRTFDLDQQVPRDLRVRLDETEAAEVSRCPGQPRARPTPRWRAVFLRNVLARNS
jgi:hypothetical protein